MIVVSRDLRKDEILKKNKSLTYLFPLIGIKKSIPINTYLFLNGDDTMRYELYCLYSYNKDNNEIEKNKNYLRSINLGDYSIHVFSCERFIQEYENFIIGRYSSFRGLEKETILGYYEFIKKSPIKEISEKYFNILKILYNIKENELKEGGSTPPVLRDETFNFYNEERKEKYSS